MLFIDSLTKVYEDNGNKTVALQDFSYNFPDKGLFFIVGKNGSGKTTLFNLISGISRRTKGTIKYDGVDITEYSNEEWENFRSNSLLYIGQNKNLIEELPIKNNWNLDLENDSSIIVNSHHIFELLKMEAIDDSKLVSELSSGQKQKILIAKALIKNKKIILADEPTENLDIDSKKYVSSFLYQLSLTSLVLFITHDESVINELSGMVISLDHGSIVSKKPVKFSMKERSELILENGQDEKKIKAENVYSALQKMLKGKTDKVTISLGDTKEIDSLPVVHDEYLKDDNKTFSHFCHTIPILPIKSVVLICILYVLSLLMFFSVSSILFFNDNKVVKKYVSDNGIRIAEPYKISEYEDALGYAKSSLTFNGKNLSKSVNQLDLTHFKVYENILISREVDEKTEYYEVKYAYYNRMDYAIIGSFPKNKDQVMLSETLYEKIYGKDASLPQNYEMDGRSISVVGIVQENKDFLNGMDENSINYYNENFFGFVYAFEPFGIDLLENYSIKYKDVALTPIVDIFDSFELYDGNNLSNGEIYVSRAYADKLKVKEGQIIHFNDIYFSSYSGVYDSFLNLSDYYPSGAKIKEIIEDDSYFIVADGVSYAIIDKDYYQYFTYSYYILSLEDKNDINLCFKEGFHFYDPNIISIEDIKRSFTSVSWILYLIFGFSILLNGLSLLALTTIIFNRNEKNIGKIRLIGIRKKTVKKACFIKSLFMVLFSIIVSFVLGFILFLFINLYYKVQSGINVQFFSINVISSLFIVFFSLGIESLFINLLFEKIYNKEIIRNLVD